MGFLIAKYAASALVIVVVSEIAKHSGKIVALVSSLPLVTIMVMIWLKIEGQDRERIAEYAKFTFWYVLPTLPMFLIMPALIQRGQGFWAALGIGLAVTIVSFGGVAWVARLFGIGLLP